MAPVGVVLKRMDHDRALPTNSSFDPSHIRATVLRMAYTGSTVHIGCAFSIVEILAVLYRDHVNLANGTPNAQGRDYVVLSKGHGVMAQYACLYQLGWLTEEDLDTYFSNGTKLKGLSDAHVPGLEVTSGSLGHGLPVAAGLALAAKRKNTGQRCYCVVGDGEMNEGSMWEALLFSAQFRLDNLILIIDENKFQAMGQTKDVLDLGNLQKKLDAFQFDTMSVDGHDQVALDKAFRNLKERRDGRPKCIVARTIKGYGISFMEANNLWHYTRLTEATYNAALAELSRV